MNARWRVRCFLLGCWVLGAGSPLLAAPADDLASPSQAKRDAAAKTLRATYRADPPADLKKVLDKLSPGMSEDAVIRRLRAFHPEGGISISSGGLRTENFELDGGWLLHCAFAWNEDSWPGSTLLFANNSYHADGRDTLFAYSLYQDLGPAEVKPPPGFTGRWVTYYLNGQRSRERWYVRGKLRREKQFGEDGHPGKPPTDDPELRIGG